LNVAGEINIRFPATDMNAGNRIGGLAGQNYGTIQNSHSSVNVTGGRNNVASLVGRNGYLTTMVGTIIGSSASGTVRATNLGVGVLVGANGGIVSDSWASGTAFSYRDGNQLGTIGVLPSNPYPNAFGNLIGDNNWYGRPGVTGGNRVENIFSTRPTNTWFGMAGTARIVTFGLDGGTLPQNQGAVATSTDRPTILPTPIPPQDYRFDGWFTEGGTRIEPGHIFNNNTTIYARFSTVPPTGLADIHAHMLALFGFLGISIVLWGIVVHSKLRKKLV
jgi:hypothetical protein